MSMIGKWFGASKRPAGDAGNAEPEPVASPADASPVAAKPLSPPEPPATPDPPQPSEPEPPPADPMSLLIRALAEASASRPPPASLPGSDLEELVRIGDEVRGRLEADPAAVKVEGTNVDMFAVRNFLSPDECAELIALIDADVKPSTILKKGADPTFRTSETCKLPASHPLVAEVERRICALLGIPISHSETVQGQRYREGQQFKVHNDYFAANQPYSQAAANEGGQRTWTAMVFLNKPAAGGQTHFPKAQVKVSPRAGALLTWNNVDREGHPNRFTHHEGVKVDAGVKYILTKWFREREWKGSEESDALRH